MLEQRDKNSESGSFWVTRHATTILFFIIVLSAAGIYLAGQIPISVFPETNFPRVVIGVDNGVMPIDQMQVTVTKPIEDAVNSVPGLTTVRSTTSRGSAEVSLFFDWNVDMFHTLQLVDAALSKVRQTLPATAVITTNVCDISDPWLQSHVRHRAAAAALGDCDLSAQAADQSARGC
jgi:multidrug efflux pump subunit AcrB